MSGNPRRHGGDALSKAVARGARGVEAFARCAVMAPR
jgi:hypothetical protein